MPAVWSLLTVAVLAAGGAALPSSKSCVNRYPRAKHIVPLYMTTYPSTGNFEANITIGSQNVTAVMDTGSTNPWFMPESVQCINPQTFEPIASDLCGYEGPRLKPSSSFQQLNAHFNMSYGSGEFLVAAAGVEKVSFAGFDLSKQEIGSSKIASVGYPGKASGLVGLAYPVLSATYPGKDPSTDVACSNVIGANNTGSNSKPIIPLMNTIFATGHVSPIFSFALGRGIPDAGIMAVGGVPDLHDPGINVTEESVQVTVAIEKFENTTDYTHYVTTVEGFHYPGAPAGAGKGQYILDTGTVPITIDKEVTEAFGASFDPPAWQNETLGGYVVQCNATAPDFSVEIAGHVFKVNGKDLILNGPPEYPFCLMGVQAGVTAPGYPPILGSVFLRNVLAVFDVGKTQMTIASRMHYEHEE